MEIKRSASRPSGKGPAEYLTGAVRVDPLFDPPGPARVNRDGKVVDWMDTSATNNTRSDRVARDEARRTKCRCQHDLVQADQTGSLSQYRNTTPA